MRNGDKETYIMAAALDLAEELLDAVTAICNRLDGIHDRLQEIQRGIDYTSSRRD